MAGKSLKSPKIYHTDSGRVVPLERLIITLGIRAVAKEYRVSESTVNKWRMGIHKPSLKTLARSMKHLFED